MKVDVKIPTDLSDIWLGTYQKFMHIAENSNDDEFIYEKMVQIFCGVELKDVLKIRWSDVQYISTKITEAFKQKPTFQKTFVLEGVEFGFIPRLDEITFGEYIDLQTNIDKMEDFHKAMAVMYRPITEKNKDKYLIEEYSGTNNYSEVMKYVTIDIALASKVFFCDLQRQLQRSTLSYLEKEMMTKEMKTSLVQELSSLKTGDGTTVSMQFLMETLQNSMKLQSCPYKTALHGSLLKSKKEILKIVKSKNN